MDVAVLWLGASVCVYYAISYADKYSKRTINAFGIEAMRFLVPLYSFQLISSG